MKKRKHRRRPWTDGEKALLRERYGKEPVAALAARLGRPAGQLYQAAYRLGLAMRRPRVTAQRLDEIRRLSLAGLTDTEIAPRLGLCRSEVSRCRRSLGLPPSAGVLRRKRDAVRAQRRTLGIETSGQLRAHAYRERVRKSGWPDGLLRREAQVLDALALYGPMSRPEIAVAIGMRWNGKKTFHTKYRPGGSYLAHLLRLGLIAVVGGPAARCAPVRGQGRGRSRRLYTLTLDALDLRRRPADVQAAAAGQAPNDLHPHRNPERKEPDRERRS